MKPAINSLLLDMDGVLYHGEKAIPDALDFMRRVGELPHAFITNNPILPPVRVADRLEGMGFKRPDERQIVTSAEATALWLARQKPDFRYFAVGAEGLHLALQAQGREDSLQADFVVIGEGPGIDFESITIGTNLILKQSAQLVCTNPDHSVDAHHEGSHRVLPGGGALVAPFAIASGKQPVIIGKPQPLLYEMAAERLGVSLANCLMIGDRPDTDIAGAARLGMMTVLVRTGRFAPGTPYPPELPGADWDVDSLTELGQILF
ncbi:MAG: HAD-IIA family hydrolase [Candidatus Thiodiazotropha endolucinida]|nr:HAD-IIA family hydrolase [Candidatus Thiodiazotropha taylori]MCG8058069.1 HAD-IIA family hydrolase [Candidatus Thiodiazotropha taylori]MCW4315127.1 HAD-IIA family hydrolase [Candidatus Thiodiazotropha taylori]MCW4319902.1 HAD-IIA family hydrolase [Candidatus Thiodiazotropha taylori]